MASRAACTSTRADGEWCTCYDLADPSHVHVHPLGDQLTHSLDEDCVCGPTAALVSDADGDDAYVITHHSLDGREANE
jgi:hypothetical protein